MPRRPGPPRARAQIYVLAGVNGAGKSSLLGEAIRALGAEYFNPDEVARVLLQDHPSWDQAQANGEAWSEGLRRLQQAIRSGGRYGFETTLGAQTISAVLADALSQGHEVRMQFVGLATPEMHLARVRERVARGGHDIPEDKIRQRFLSSRTNLIRLMPALTSLDLYDNSRHSPPGVGPLPRLQLLLRTAHGRLTWMAPRDAIPEWARPIAAAAMLGPRA